MRDINTNYTGRNKWICGVESAGHRSHTYIHTYYRIFTETLVL
jgi:hypothetical protein